MSVDHATSAPSPAESQTAPAFLSVRPGNFVIVKAQQQVALQPDEDWWLGQVLWREGGARDPKINSLFQIADVDDGSIRWVNADEVTHILHSLDGLDP